MALFLKDLGGPSYFGRDLQITPPPHRRCGAQGSVLTIKESFISTLLYSINNIFQLSSLCSRNLLFQLSSLHSRNLYFTSLLCNELSNTNLQHRRNSFPCTRLPVLLTQQTFILLSFTSGSTVPTPHLSHSLCSLSENNLSFILHSWSLIHLKNFGIYSIFHLAMNLRADLVFMFLFFSAPLISGFSSAQIFLFNLANVVGAFGWKSLERRPIVPLPSYLHPLE